MTKLAKAVGYHLGFMRNSLTVGFLLVFSCLPAAPQSAAEKANQALARQTRYTEAALSPDGKQIAWVESVAGANGVVDRDTAIYLAQTDSKEKRRITAGTSAVCIENSAAWSPDGNKLAFLSDCAKAKQPELYTVDASGGNPQQQTTLTGYLSHPTWAPNGKSIALLFIENANRESGPLVASHRDAGVVEEHFQEQRLALIDTATRTVRPLSPADTYVYEYDWSSDSRMLAYTAAKGNGDNNWWIAELFTIDAQTGKIAHVLKPAAQIAVPRFSPDGSKIAFISGLMSDEGSTGGDIYAVNSSGGEAVDLTPGRKSSPNWLQWLPSKQILFTETVDGGSAIASLNPETKEAEVLWRGDESIHAGSDALSVADDGKTVAAVRSGWKLAPEVWSGPINEWKKQTGGNDDQKPVIGNADKLHWSSDGTQVEGWLVYPVNYDAGKRYPMVVIVHGGPAAAAKPRWPSEYDNVLLSAEGYFVADAESARQLWRGRSIYKRQRQRLRLWRSEGHQCRRGRSLENAAHRCKPARRNRLELRRVHDHVDSNPDESFSCSCGRRRHLELAELLWREPDRSVDDSLFRSICLRRSEGLCAVFSNYVHKECENSYADSGWRQRRRMSSTAVLRVLACSEDRGSEDPVCGLSR